MGGALGALFRYALSLFIKSSYTYDFPWHTLLTNLSGCLCIGIVWGYSQVYHTPDWVSVFLITGILGGYTTFSSFALEFVQLTEQSKIAAAFLYVSISNIAGLLLTYSGYKTILAFVK